MPTVRPQIPQQGRPFIDEKTNRVDTLWYLYLRGLRGIVMDTYTVTADDDTANTATINTGVKIYSAIVQILRSGKVVSSDPAVSYSTTNLTVANGSSYVLTTGDIINYIVIGA